MPGLSLTAYLDFQINTGPVFLSGTDNIINNVSRRSFLLGKMLRGSPASETLQGGDQIQETLYLNANRTFQSFGRNQDVSWQNPQKDVLMQLPWRFALDHMSWDEAEYLLQVGRGVKYKDMAYSKQQRLWESAIDGMESKLWQSPGTTSTDAAMFGEMEGNTGIEWYSVPVFVHENAGTNGRFTTGWTTIEGVNPATYPNWDNARATYNYTDVADVSNAGTGLFDAFDEISLATGYERPGFKDEYFEPDNAYGNGKDEKRSSNHIIAASKKGMKQIMRLHRQSNADLIQPQDAAYPLPRWNGIPIKDVSALDDAPLYAGSGVNVGELAATVTKPGPRYYFLNTSYLKLIFHSEKYFAMQPRKTLEAKVGVHVIPVEVWGNMCCTSRRYQGLVSPA